MNRKICVIFVLFLFAIFAVSTIITKAESQIELTPTSGEPGDSVHVKGSEFAASKSVGIGLGAEVVVIDESVTMTDTGLDSNPRTISGNTAKHPIKPGSLRWQLDIGGFLAEYFDLGNGTLGAPVGYQPFTSVINYTSGYFSRTTTGMGVGEVMGSEVNYTTYDAGVALDGLGTDGSGVLSGNFTVPDNIWNGTHTVTVIDEAGNKATSEFTVYGSDVPIAPEAFTVGALVLLTSTAIVVSFYWLKKKPSDKMVKYS
jgi:hypothetical protein